MEDELMDGSVISMLHPMIQASKLLQMKKQSFHDVGGNYSLCTYLNLLQVIYVIVIPCTLIRHLTNLQKQPHNICNYRFANFMVGVLEGIPLQIPLITAQMSILLKYIETLIMFCILIFKSLYIFSHKPEVMMLLNSPVYIHVHVYTREMIFI